MEPLFRTSPKTKTAQLTTGQMPTNAVEWPVKIRDEWAKIAPFAAEYPTEIVISERDEQRGYGFGHLIVTSRTALQAPQAYGQLGAQFGVKTVKVPIIIEDFNLSPMDLLVTEEGAILPLSDARLREALFRPGLFDVPSKGPGNELFGAVLYPPMREANLTKASAYPILETIADTVEKNQIDRLAGFIKAGELEEDVVSNPHVATYLRLVNRIPAEGPISKEAALGSVVPDVVCVTREPGPSYRVKTAMRQAFDPQEYVFERGEALEQLGEEVVKEADVKGMMIIIRRRAGSSEPQILDGGSSDSFSDGMTGPVKVMSGGREMLGNVFSKIRSLLSGSPIPMSVFSDGEHTGMQENIGCCPSGEPVPDLASEVPQGMGCFCWDEGGEKVCSEPVTVTGATVEGGRTAFLCETGMGQRLSVVPSESAQSVAPGGTGFVLIPASSCWIQLGQKIVPLATANEANAQVETKTAESACDITFSDRLFNISGTPLFKLGNLAGLGATDAMFVCGLMGLSKESAERALARAYKTGSVRIVGVEPIVQFDELQDEIRKQAAEALEGTEDLILPFLVKEATSLGDPQSVDAILSLGFLNLDNVSRFVTFIPHLESTVRKLCALLLATRLGLTELPEDQLSRAISAIEHALGGLRRVALRLSPVNAPLS